MLTFGGACFFTPLVYYKGMKRKQLPAQLPAHAALPQADRIAALRAGMAYTNAVAQRSAQTAQTMLETLAFSTMVADKAEVGTIGRQREFQNVETLTRASIALTECLMNVAKTMAGFTSPAPHTMVQINNYDIPKPKRERGSVTIDASRPAVDALAHKDCGYD